MQRDNRRRGAGRTATFAEPSRQPARLFEVTGLTQRLPVYATAAAAALDAMGTELDAERAVATEGSRSTGRQDGHPIPGMAIRVRRRISATLSAILMTTRRAPAGFDGVPLHAHSGCALSSDCAMTRRMLTSGR
ncbi:hypothetical protein [Nonomuraea sp. NPDC049750]|uniref:hypothetical protein n=1 Tax=Nonomuraea sp. NPDC049750 TaxID=3154738 RepID=UPI0033F3C805